MRITRSTRQMGTGLRQALIRTSWVVALAVTLVATSFGDAAEALVRVRKNANTLTGPEKLAFVQACLDLKSAGGIDANQLPWHQTGSNLGWAHQSRSFLPWHREYLRRFEDALRLTSGGAANVTIPYWDSSSPGNPFSPGLAGELGAAGNPSAIPSSSPFGTAAWPIMPGFGVLLRNHVLFSLPAAATVASAISTPVTYADFYNRVEIQTPIHVGPHGAVGGHMGSIASAPNDPVFYMHHAWVDRLWCQWQASHRKAVQFTNSDLAKGIDTPMQPWNQRTPRQTLVLADDGIRYDDCTGLACVQRPANMVAWWANCDVRDISGNGNHATLLKQSTCPADSKVGGQALRFVAALGEYDQVPNSTSLNFGTGDFSIDLWVKVGATTSSTRFLVDKRNSSSVGYAFYLNNGKPGLTMGDGTNFVTVDTTTNVADGLWHHLAVTVDRDQAAGIVFYVDGAVVLTGNPTTATGSITTTNVLRIGAVSGFSPAAFYDGLMDEIEIFNRALGAPEVASVYLADVYGKCKPKLFIFYPFPKCYGTFVKGTQKLVDTIGKVVKACHSGRIKGKISSMVDCNAISVSSDPKGSVAKAEQKMITAVNKSCSPNGLGSPESLNFNACPEPCDASVPVIRTFADVSACEICLARQDVLQMSARTLGSPTAPSSAAAKCHGAMTKNQAKFVKSAIRHRARCRSIAEHLGTPPPYPCDSAGIEKALLKAEAGIGKSCSQLNAGELASLGTACSTASFTAFQECVLSDWEAHGEKLFRNLDSLDEAPLCGNGVVDGGEQCDDAGESLACDEDCSLPSCGDGLVNVTTGEECDDANVTLGDGCDINCLEESYCACIGGEMVHPCTLTSNQTQACQFGETCNCPFCGDGTVDLGEVCDTAGDSASCDANCTSPVCGDATLNSAAGETCDDGNANNGDGCTAICQPSTCVGGSNNGAACETSSQCPGGICL